MESLVGFPGCGFTSGALTVALNEVFDAVAIFPGEEDGRGKMSTLDEHFGIQ